MIPKLKMIKYIQKIVLLLSCLVAVQEARSQVPAFNANYQPLNFVKSRAIRVVGNSDTAQGATLVYRNVITVSGIEVDAVVKNITVSNISFNNYDPDSQTAIAGQNQNSPNWFIAEFGGSGSGYTLFEFSFIEGGTYVDASNPGNPVILQKVYLNSYDIDGAGSTGTNQFVEFGGFKKLEVSQNTVLTTTFNNVTGLTRFRSSVTTNNSDSPGTANGDRYRVRVTYDEMSTFRISLGRDSSTAYFALDFSASSAFINVSESTGPSLDLDVYENTFDATYNSATFTGTPLSFTKANSANVTGANIETVSNANFAFLNISFATADIRDGVNESISMGGTTIPLNFANNTTFPNITVGNVIYSATGTVSNGIHKLVFSRTGGTEMFTPANAEALLDALRYTNFRQQVTPGLRTFNVNVVQGAFISNTADFFVKVTDNDGDGIADIYDLDTDNDGITDCVEKGIGGEIDDAFTFVTSGSAVKKGPLEAQLTPNADNMSGQLWSKGQVDFNKSFTLSYEAFFGTNDGGADGIATVFHNDPAKDQAIGVNGEGIGAGNIENGIVLELDTYANTGELAADHGHIWRSVDGPNIGSLTTPIGLPFNLEDGTWRTVVVSWNADTQTLSYTVSGILAGSYTGNLIDDIFGTNLVHFGYTASTGGAMNDQRIRFTNLCNLPLELDTDGDGIPNHLDLDSDNDGCPDATEGLKNITAERLNADGSIKGSTDTNGVPTAVNGGQQPGSAYNPKVNACFLITNPMIRQRIQ